MNMQRRRRAMRTILEGAKCARPAIVYDPVSVRIAEELGYACGMIPGSDVALSVLGAPDITLITMTEFTGQVHRLTRTGELPLIADGDHGYGNAINVQRFVRELETIGLCAVTIEDTELPAAFGTTKARLISLEEAQAKLRAAVAAREDPDFIIIGRTNATLAAGGLAEVIARMKAYESAGVDALFVQGIATRADFETIAAATHLPFVIPRPSAEMEDVGWLESQRVRVAFPAGKKPYNAAIEAAHQKFVEQNPGATALADNYNDLVKRVTRAADYQQARHTFVSGTGSA